VLIASALTEARDVEHAPTGVVGRWRATLAHEASRIFLHRYLFDPEMAQLAGRGGVAVLGEGGLMRCLHRDISPTVADWSSMRRRSDWREVQANRAMAALLMPRRLFRRLALREMRQLGRGTPPVAVPDVEVLATALADLLQVSRQAARIRLDSGGLIARD
jgi:IrrE N-terminal-like domain